jgi:hypothetical protein
MSKYDEKPLFPNLGPVLDNMKTRGSNSKIRRANNYVEF